MKLGQEGNKIHLIIINQALHIIVSLDFSLLVL